ncbi:probable multidrug resistance-associated protein lethal(2)03659 isoform X2 [Zophobas morio]|uniref:probable multidrug resistance-associated protein lethal(2)03659 isoform X2 n=1 Tax=Zophobas morio TaxID=2755281 RepID=UPI0030834423
MEGKHNPKTQIRSHPREKANYLSHWFFCWQLPFFYKGYKKQITEEDLYGPLKDHKSKLLGDKLEKTWLTELKTQKNPSLWRTLRKVFGPEFLFYGLTLIVQELIVRMCPPILIGKLMSYYTPNQTSISKNEAYIYASCIVFASFLYVMMGHSYLLGLLHLGMKMRIAISSLVYRKSLKLSQSAIAENTAGHLLNLLANDITRFDYYVVKVHYLWMGPVETLLVCGLIYWMLGATAIIGIVILLAFIPVQVYLAKRMSVYRLRTAIKTDQRVKLMNEIITGVKVIKMYSWEKPFAKLVELARKLEVDQIKISSYLRAFNMASQLFLGRIAVFFCILIYILTGGTLEPQYVYVLTSFYEIIRLGAVIFLPLSMMEVGEIMTSMKRILEFLKQPEVTSIRKYNHESIKMNNVCVKWDKSPKNTLTNINLDIKSNQLVTLIGAVGSGKTTLLHVILQEIPLLEGSFEAGGTISYASQQPWLFSASIRDNILFGEKFDKNDPLSAVDVHVGKQIFEKCIRNYLKNKTTILITHQIQYLDNTDIVYLIENGKIMESGTLLELTEKNTGFLNVLEKRTDVQDDQQIESKYNLEESTERPLEVKESQGTGAVSNRVYRDYFLAGGPFLIGFIVILLHGMVQTIAVGGDYFLSFWVNLEQDNATSTHDFLTTDNCLYIYGCLTLLVIIIALVCSFRFFWFCITTSTNLHNKMFRKIVYSSMRFFNTNESGRILNRFSKDIGLIDENLPLSMMDTIQISFNVLAIAIIIAIVNPWIVIPTVVMFTIFYFYRKICLASTRNLKRIEGTARSPIYSHVTSSLEGISTIRAFSAQNNLQNEFDQRQDSHSSSFYMFLACDSAFGFWLDLCCVVFLGIVTFSILLMGSGNYGANMGLAITQSIMMTGLLQWGMKQSAQLENQMTSVERVVEYTKLEPESDQGTKQISKEWPATGKIEFNTVSLRYSSQDPWVLKKLTFDIRAKEKVGIVGRTGAGKSSLISVLFRLAPTQGEVFIDDVNIKTINLESLRSKITIIPQDPVLFSGTIRYNLDPFDEYQDSQLWDALEEVELKNLVSGFPAGLSNKVLDGGANFSVGQRQLLCLARAVVRMNKILILDEATANVDPRTDELIQKTIRSEFRECTVLTIAHRLNTVMDSDRILVMSDGCVVEFDEPRRLLENTNGVFYRLIKQAGSEIQKLTDLNEM